MSFVTPTLKCVNFFNESIDKPASFKEGILGKRFLFLAFRERKELATKTAADGNPVVSAQEGPSKALGHLSISANPNLSFW